MKIEFNKEKRSQRKRQNWIKLEMKKIHDFTKRDLEEGFTNSLYETQDRILGFEDKIEDLDHSAKEIV